MSKPVLVCCDRDGTINRDENYFLGANLHWKSQIEILPGVAEGIRFLNEENIPVFVVTNQAGVALTGIDMRVGIDFDNLTQKRVEEVNEYLTQKLGEQGARVTECIYCPFVDNAYVDKSRRRGRRVDSEYVKDGCPDLKPGIGMLERAAGSLGLRLEDCGVYVIGDRDSDVRMGLNANGKGVLVESSKTVERGDHDKIAKLSVEHPGRVYLASNFLDGVNWIIRDVEGTN